MTEIETITMKLREAAETRGCLARISKASGVSERTIYNFLHSEGKPNPMTVEKLAKHFKKADRKAGRNI